jgi:hypothetical protein
MKAWPNCTVSHITSSRGILSLRCTSTGGTDFSYSLILAGQTINGSKCTKAHPSAEVPHVWHICCTGIWQAWWCVRVSGVVVLLLFFLTVTAPRLPQRCHMLVYMLHRHMAGMVMCSWQTNILVWYDCYLVCALVIVITYAILGLSITLWFPIILFQHWKMISKQWQWQEWLFFTPIINHPSESLVTWYPIFE